MRCCVRQKRWRTWDSNRSHYKGYQDWPGVEQTFSRTTQGSVELQASRQRFVDTLYQVLRKEAGFANEGVPLIVDNSLGVNPQSVAAALRERDFNARSVKEIFGDKDPRDPAIRSLAERIGGKVIAVDKGATPGEGFFRSAIRIPGQVRTEASVIRLVEEAL